MALSANSSVKDLLYQHSGWTDATLWTFYLFDDTVVMRWTEAAFDIDYDGQTYQAKQVGITATLGECASGLSPATIEIEIAGTISVGGAPLTQAMLGLAFSGARVVMRRVYFDAPYPAGAILGAITEFDGRVCGQDPGSLRSKLTAKTSLARAESMKGFRVVGSVCPFVLYSSECGATIQEATATVAAGSTVRQVNLTSVPSVAGMGSRVLFTSGPLSGVAGMVRSVGSGSVVLDRDLAQAPAAGATCKIRKACNHSLVGCGALNNLLRNGGAPAMPMRDLWTPEG